MPGVHNLFCDLVKMAAQPYLGLSFPISAQRGWRRATWCVFNGDL